jgi:HEXXH motif-containing protein
VVPIPPALTAELAERGLVGIEASSVSLRLLGDALHWIARVPDLASIVHALVSEIHLLAAESGYDVSHSEPRWRSSIFVSIPDRRDETGALRLAESVVHEAMHLQLTNREQLQQLVALEDGAMQSPWRDEPRSYRGVLHGLYVFSCLAAFFRSLLSEQALGEAGRRHAVQRVREIAQQVESIDFGALAAGLTDAGTALVQLCRRVATPRSAARA